MSVNLAFLSLISLSFASKYAGLSGVTTWADARVRCKTAFGEESDLAIIRTESDNTEAFNECLKVNSNGFCWLGASDIQNESIWKWVDGSLVTNGHSNWNSGEPNNGGGGTEHCMELRPTKRWNDIPCDYTSDSRNHMPLCQVPTSIPTAQPTKTPSDNPLLLPSGNPSVGPTPKPTSVPTKMPTDKPSQNPTKEPLTHPTFAPSAKSTHAPTKRPSKSPSKHPTFGPSQIHSVKPTDSPSPTPTEKPTQTPSTEPTNVQTFAPNKDPTLKPSGNPSGMSSSIPTPFPSESPIATKTTEVSDSSEEWVYAITAEDINIGTAVIVTAVFFICAFCGYMKCRRQQKIHDDHSTENGQPPPPPSVELLQSQSPRTDTDRNSITATPISDEFGSEEKKELLVETVESKENESTAFLSDAQFTETHVITAPPETSINDSIFL